MVDERPQPVADRSARRLCAAADEQSDLVHDGVGGQRLAIDPSVDPLADQILPDGATGPLPGDPAESRRELDVGLDEVDERRPVTLAHVGAHQALAPRLDLRPHLLRVTEQLARQPRGELAGQRADDLHPARTAVERDTECGIDQLGGQRVDLRASSGDGRPGERGLHDHSLLTVTWIVAGDHVRLPRRPQGAIALPGHEDRAAPLDLLHVGMPGDAPEPVAVIAVHGLVGPHPRPHVVRVAAIQLRIEQVDVEAFSDCYSHVRIATTRSGRCVHRRTADPVVGS